MNCERDCECCDRHDTCDMPAAITYRNERELKYGKPPEPVTQDDRLDAIEDRLTAIEGILTNMAGVILLDAEGRP